MICRGTAGPVGVLEGEREGGKYGMVVEGEALSLRGRIVHTRRPPASCTSRCTLVGSSVRTLVRRGESGQEALWLIAFSDSGRAMQPLSESGRAMQPLIGNGAMEVAALHALSPALCCIFTQARAMGGIFRYAHGCCKANACNISTHSGHPFPPRTTCVLGPAPLLLHADFCVAVPHPLPAPTLVVNPVTAQTSLCGRSWTPCMRA